ncbi:MAG: DUF4116 domain-containing protein, partial [Candidatus Rhabdochlamydia sp.]
MNTLFPTSPYSKYCSQQGSFSPHFNTLEEGIGVIENLLQKKILCRHDVAHLTQIYQTVDELEKNSEKTSHAALHQVIWKIETAYHEALAEQIITAYHLEQFKVFPLKQVWTTLLSPLKLPLEKIKEIAVHIPFCESEQAFDTDVKALLGTTHSEETLALLQTKKDQFCEYQQTIRAHQLKELREQNASLYPSYLEEILHKGFFHLYDHLIAMKALSTKIERTAAIKNLSFSSFAKIILEFREAVLSQTENMISSQNTNIVFLLGNTGSGKSTTLCYLRGDQMIFQDNAYESSMDRGHLIGSDGETSYTLFPNIAVKDDLVLVDFPGFVDTHGEVITLAIELTLRALTRKYAPKIILLIPITDTESRFEHVHLLGKRLERILGTLDNCLLGLTKYSKDMDFIEIKKIEEKQRKKLFSPSKEEENIIHQIKALEPFAESVPTIQAQVDQHKERLSKLQELRPSPSTHQLPDTEKKSKYYQKLLQKEEAFKKHSGINHVICLKDLTDQTQLEEILKTFSSQKSIPLTHRDNQLDSTDKDLLEFLFENNLKNVIASQENRSILSLNASATSDSKDTLSKGVEAFEQSILETSLIHTILAKSHEEIGKFLHLEEMDIMIVKEYDKKVITDCIQGCIDEVILGLLVTEGIIKKLEKTYSKQQSKEAQHEWSLLKSYILTLTKGLPQEADEKKVKEAWESLQKEHQERLQGTEKELTPPGWLKKILFIPLGIPYGIFAIFKKIKLDNTSKKFLEETDQNLHQKIKAAAQAVIALKDIENTVRKKDRFNKIFSSYPLLLDSVSSLQDSLESQITRVKMIYGEKEWEDRVAFLMDQLKANFSLMRSGSPLGETILCALLSQEVSWEKFPPCFDQPMFLALIYSFIKFQKNYQEIRNQLVPNQKAPSYQDLKLSNPSHFFHSLSVTEQEYNFLKEQGKNLFESSYKTPISRLLLADAIYELSKELFLINENAEKIAPDSSTLEDEIKILEAIKDDEGILGYSKEWLRNSKFFILSAVRNNGKAFQFATDLLKKDREFVLTIMKENGEALKYASETLKNDKEIVLTAVQENGLSLQYANEILKNDKEIVLHAVKENGLSLQYASETLKNDQEIVLNAVMENGLALLYANETLKNDREVVLTATWKNGLSLQYANETLKNDLGVVLTAVQENGLALQYANETLKNALEIVITAIQKNGLALQYVNEMLKNIPEIVHTAIQKNGLALEYVNESLKNDQEIVLAAVRKNGLALQYANESLKNDKEVVLAAVKENGFALQYANESLKNNKEVALTALRQNGLALQYANEILKSDKEIVL